MKLPQLTLKIANHKGVEVAQLLFAKNDELLQLLKTTNYLRWSKTMSCWYLPYKASIKNYLSGLLNGKAILNLDSLTSDCRVQSEPFKPLKIGEKKPTAQLPALNEASQKSIKEFTNWLKSKRYSNNTIDTYIDALKIFLRFYSCKDIREINNTDVINFNNDYILANKLSGSFQNQIVNAIKLFFSTMQNKQLQPELIHRPKTIKLLPNVLSKEEVKAILNALGNIKHKTMLSLIYSCGLRRGELLKLKLTDIDAKRHLVIIKQAKGRKDRIVPLSEKTLELLREYYKIYTPKNWLFEGQDGENPYDERSLQNVLKSALSKSKINKAVTLHWLRHSYATHLLENGTDLRYIQEILGHSSSRTTEIYTHVSTRSIQNVISPFDSL